jgi:hypothetical protein
VPQIVCASLAADAADLRPLELAETVGVAITLRRFTPDSLDTLVYLATRT